MFHSVIVPSKKAYGVSFPQPYFSTDASIPVFMVSGLSGADFWGTGYLPKASEDVPTCSCIWHRWWEIWGKCHSYSQVGDFSVEFGIFSTLFLFWSITTMFIDVQSSWLLSSKGSFWPFWTDPIFISRCLEHDTDSQLKLWPREVKSSTMSWWLFRQNIPACQQWSVIIIGLRTCNFGGDWAVPHSRLVL